MYNTWHRTFPGDVQHSLATHWTWMDSLQQSVKKKKIIHVEEQKGVPMLQSQEDMLACTLLKAAMNGSLHVLLFAPDDARM